MTPTSEQIDVLRELVLIGMGRAAGILNEMLHHQIQLHVPDIKVFPAKDLKREITKVETMRLSAVQMGFKGSFSGTAALLFPSESASNLVDLLSGEDWGNFDMDSIRIGTLTEVGNILINGVMGSIGNVLNQSIQYSLPSYTEITIKNLVASHCPEPTSAILLAQTSFNIDALQIKGNIVLLFESAFDELLFAINRILEANLGRT